MRYPKSTACAIGVGTALAKRTCRKDSPHHWQFAWLRAGPRSRVCRSQMPPRLCARDKDELERARQALSREGHEVFTFPCDISDRDQVARSTFWSTTPGKSWWRRL